MDIVLFVVAWIASSVAAFFMFIHGLKGVGPITNGDVVFSAALAAIPFVSLPAALLVLGVSRLHVSGWGKRKSRWFNGD